MNTSQNNHQFSLFTSIFSRLIKPVIVFLVLLIANFLLSVVVLPEKTSYILNKSLFILQAASFAWILVAFVNVGQDYAYYAYNLKKADNLRERKIRTQLQFLRKIALTLIVILTFCVILMSFENLRKIGTGLLTGVGISGIIIGFAAQRSIGNLLAGFQIAFTQPIRLDDVLIVEGEWGRVEEINLTYVVVSIWDQRRLVLPINYFIEKPFQNWTRNSAEILGTAFIYLDYTAPVDAIRAEFKRLVAASDLWDGRVAVMQVTNITEHNIEIRGLMSAENSGKAFDLRCYVRENLISFVQKNYPGSLPRSRHEIPDIRSGAWANPRN